VGGVEAANRGADAKDELQIESSTVLLSPPCGQCALLLSPDALDHPKTWVAVGFRNPMA